MALSIVWSLWFSTSSERERTPSIHSGPTGGPLTVGPVGNGAIEEEERVRENVGQRSVTRHPDHSPRLSSKSKEEKLTPSSGNFLAVSILHSGDLTTPPKMNKVVTEDSTVSDSVTVIISHT